MVGSSVMPKWSLNASLPLLGGAVRAGELFGPKKDAWRSHPSPQEERRTVAELMFCCQLGGQHCKRRQRRVPIRRVVPCGGPPAVGRSVPGFVPLGLKGLQVAVSIRQGGFAIAITCCFRLLGATRPYIIWCGGCCAPYNKLCHPKLA